VAPDERTRRAFDEIMGSLDAPMAVVTAVAGGERAGCLVGFHAQCSIAPGQHAVWLSKANHTYRVALRATHLGIHLLTEDDHALAHLFGAVSGDDADKFAGLEVEDGPEGLPLLVGCPHRITARRVALLDIGGDHVCVATEPVEAVSRGPFRPLRLSAVRDIDAGHEVDERPRPPTQRAVDPAQAPTSTAG
jgi:flavin reductase (DIM6/NTAB) family NADH-FMN oxidoreductase RutF